MELSYGNHCARRSVWHIEWCTKYRYKMMRKLENRNMVAACIRQAASRHWINVLALEVMPEHMHGIFDLPKGTSEERAAKLLKGYSSWEVFRVKPEYRLRYPKGHFWSRGYMARTVGVDEQRAILYVQNQQTHHNVTFL
ncbi:MAG TPA: IS200/IS605 family transposase [archaeon]|nr:IS200/IS605 family transposase [archaeon]